METKKKIEVTVETTDGIVVELGDCVTFSCSGKEFIGKFDGIDNRGNWKFAGATELLKDVYFTVAPRSIQKMYKVDMDVMSVPFPMNPPVESEEE